MTQAVFYEGHRQIRVGRRDPIAPGDDEVQLKVSHCGICGTDLHIFHGAMDQRVTMPQVLGHEMPGTVHRRGAAVEDFRIGERVTVMPLVP